MKVYVAIDDNTRDYTYLGVYGSLAEAQREHAIPLDVPGVHGNDWVWKEDENLWEHRFLTSQGTWATSGTVIIEKDIEVPA